MILIGSNVYCSSLIAEGELIWSSRFSCWSILQSRWKQLCEKIPVPASSQTNPWSDDSDSHQMEKVGLRKEDLLPHTIR